MYSLSRVSLQHPDSIWSPSRNDGDAQSWKDPLAHGRTRSGGAVIIDRELHAMLMQCKEFYDMSTIAELIGMSYTLVYRFARGNGEKGITTESAAIMREGLKDLLARNKSA